MIESLQPIKTFRMSYGRAVPYICGGGVVVILLLSYVLLAHGILWVGGGMLILSVATAVWMAMVFRNPPVYVVDDGFITLRNMGKQTSYPIDRIDRIQYFDLGVEYSRGTNNARFQVGIYFDRSLFKSVEPIAFCPDDRDGFVNAILALNPTIPVNRKDRHPK